MRRLEPELLRFWEEASLKYHKDLGERAVAYLTGRGLSMSTVDCCRIGYVDDPMPGHEPYQGRIALPVLKRRAVVGFQFRCIEDHSCKAERCPKYLTDGDQWLYNTAALDEPGDIIALCEGAFDAYILSYEVGVPTMGIPGVESWKGHPWWADVVKGHRYKYFFADNDAGTENNPGLRLAREVRQSIPSLRIVPMPEGEDPTSTFLRYGAEEIYRRSGLTPPTRRLELVS